MKKIAIDSSKLKLSFVSTALAAVMALTMVPAAAVETAFADEAISPQTSVVEGWDVQFNNQTVTVQAGEQVDMNQYLKKDYPQWPEGYTGHIDWRIVPSSSLASINKHSGILTANAAGTVTVRASLIEGEQKQIQGLCGEEMAYATKDVTITAPPEEYGFQGGSNAIMMVFPEVTSFSGNLQDGYVNTITDAHQVDGYVYFTYQTTTGFTRYATPESYSTRNAGQIVLTSGRNTYSLGDMQGVLSVSSFDTENNRITIRVATAYLTRNAGTLTFNKDLRGNSDDRTLETTVKFNFNVIN